ncbi:MAG: DUF4350 domain-containing protein [Betaproteobacteria bacterium]|nr:DUF4350 domain-containing protein [Betaproteobacteria bacterium]
MTARRLFLVAIGLGLIALTWWAIENVTWEEVRVPAQPKGEAALNPLFAAERLLTELGAKATSARSFRADLLPADPARAVLILPTQRRTLSPTQHATLEDWVRRGGHLVAVAYSMHEQGERADPLMAALGVKRVMRKVRPRTPPAPPLAPDANEERAARPDAAPPQPAPGEDDLVDDEFAHLPSWIPRPKITCAEQRDVAGSAPPPFPARTLRVCFSPFSVLRYSAAAGSQPLWRVETVHRANSLHAIALPLGRGRVTVLSDWRFLANDDIGRDDHADFLVAMLGGDLKALTVLLVPSEDVPGLHKLIWRHGAAVVLTLAVLLTVLLWRAGTRLGPVAARAEPVRRSLLEHVRAMGEFVWREKSASALWRSAVARTKQRTARVLTPTRDPGVMVRALAKKSALPEDLIRESLFPSTDPSPERFARAIATLAKLRKSL